MDTQLEEKVNRYIEKTIVLPLYLFFESTGKDFTLCCQNKILQKPQKQDIHIDRKSMRVMKSISIQSSKCHFPVVVSVYLQKKEVC